jgi:hypothetical protein
MFERSGWRQAFFDATRCSSDAIRLDSTRLDSTRLDSTRRYSIRLDSTLYYSTLLDSTRLDSTRLDSTRLDPTRLDSTQLYKVETEADDQFAPYRYVEYFFFFLFRGKIMKPLKEILPSMMSILDQDLVAIPITLLNVSMIALKKLVILVPPHLNVDLVETILRK